MRPFDHVLHGKIIEKRTDEIINDRTHLNEIKITDCFSSVVWVADAQLIFRFVHRVSVRNFVGVVTRKKKSTFRFFASRFHMFVAIQRTHKPEDRSALKKNRRRQTAKSVAIEWIEETKMKSAALEMLQKVKMLSTECHALTHHSHFDHFTRKINSTLVFGSTHNQRKIKRSKKITK